MKYFAIEWNDSAVQWDREYGIDHRRGWSVVIRGCVVVQFQPWLIVALWKAWRRWRTRIVLTQELLESVDAAIARAQETPRDLSKGYCPFCNFKPCQCGGGKTNLAYKPWGGNLQPRSPQGGAT